MLRNMCAEQPKTWDRYVEALVFAYREAPSGKSLFAPFELLYYRSERGPLCCRLRKRMNQQELVNSMFLNYKKKLKNTCMLPHNEVQNQQGGYKF